jgi:hypothetical protein
MMELRRQDGFLITEHFQGWSGWHAAFSQPIIPTVRGVLYFQKIAVRTYSAKTTLLFGQGWEGGHIDNLEILRNLAHDLTPLNFTDKEGWTVPVLAIFEDETETMEEVRTKSVYMVPVTLHRPGYIA